MPASAARKSFPNLDPCFWLTCVGLAWAHPPQTTQLVWIDAHRFVPRYPAVPFSGWAFAAFY